jgi:hypothetical protein
VVLKREAKNALAKLWSFHLAYLEAEEAAFRQVAVLLVTTDVALKIFGRASTPGSPAARLMKTKVCSPHLGRDAEVPDRDLLRPGQPA